MCVCVQDLQESEGCQDELALRVQQLKAELVLFKGLMSNVSAAQLIESFTSPASQWKDCSYSTILQIILIIISDSTHQMVFISSH